VPLDDEVFLDTAYVIALANPADEHHQRAATLAASFNLENVRMVTTRAVLLEVGSCLARLRFRAAAVRLLNIMETSPSILIMSVDEVLARRGLELFCRRADKEWSWTDCISFLVMEQKRLRQALTTDEHFEQAGFVALLRT
jgi:predicted nucleic acid-binding protein